MERLGQVQIDTIAVVQRAHHHILWSRRADYRPQMLGDLLAVDRRVFEYWAPAASYVPMADYRYYLPAMRGFGKGGRPKRWIDEHRGLMRHVLARIRKEGPLGSADFAAPDGRKRGGWWDWKPVKQALELLFSMGELMVTERRNFQRLYDLAERVLPDDVDISEPTRDELGRFVVARLLSSQGVARIDGWRVRHRRLAAQALGELIAAGEATPVEIDGVEGAPYAALTKDLQAASRRRSARPRLHILSPFDSLVIDRWRTRRLFGFEFKLECYLPAAKRRWGYFCLPILWGDRFIGRLDPKADRRAATLVVRKLMFERGFREYEAVLSALAEKLRAFAAFNECSGVALEQAQPRKVGAALRRLLCG